MNYYEVNKNIRDMWDGRFSGEEYAYGSVPNRYFRERLKGLPAGRIFFICEGEGRNAVYAAFQGWTSYAMDYSIKGRAKAMRLAEAKKVPLVYDVASVQNYQFPVEAYDAVVLIFAHFEPILRTYVHAQARKCLKKGGKLIFEAFSKNQMDNQSGGPLKIEELYDPEDLRNDFAGFDFTELSENEIIINEGLYHIGKASVVRIFGTKL